VRQSRQEIIFFLIRCGQCRYLVTQCLQLLPQVRSVAKDLAKPQKVLVLVAQGNQYAARPESRAVSANLPSIIFRFAEVERKFDFLTGNSLLHIFRSKKVGKRLTYHVARAAVKNIFGAGTPPQDPRVSI
jgi:hypothetical protein